MTALHAVTPAEKPSASVVYVTPEIASRWLGKNVKNRNLRQSVVRGYARDMAAGNWLLTGEAVKFDTDGNLIDGQHRLMAIVQSGRTVPLFVVRGVAADAQHVMDTGAKRSASDALGLQGHKHATLVAAASRLGIVIESGRDARNVAPTHSEISEYLDAHPELSAHAPAVDQIRRHVDLPPSVLLFAWSLFSARDPEACVTFFESLANNATTGPGDPRNTLLHRIASARRQRERLTQETSLNMLIRTWNAWRKGQSLKVLKVTAAAPGSKGAKAVALPKVV